MAATIEIGQRLMLPAMIVQVYDSNNILVDVCGVRVAIDKASLSALCIDASAGASFTAPVAAAWQTHGDARTEGDIRATWHDAMVAAGIEGFSA